MSGTAKLLLTSSVLAALASPSFAQDPAADLFADFFESKSTAPAQATAAAAPSPSDEIKQAIRKKILEVATASKQIEQMEGSSTIKEIDDLNRSAARAKTELDLEKTQLERMQTELSGMLALYEALKSLEETPTDPRREEGYIPPSPDANTTPEDFQPPAPSPRDIEAEKLPQITSIMGASGSYKASVTYPDGTMEQVEKGYFLDGGFEVVEITSKFVVIRGDLTGSDYRISPKKSAAPTSEDGAGSNPAIDLGNLPFGVF
jgi:type IV pilus biogenesis protein PilP